MPADPIYTLSPSEKQVFNGLSQRVDRNILLGDRIQSLLTLLEGSKAKVPVKVSAGEEVELFKDEPAPKKKKVP